LTKAKIDFDSLNETATRRTLELSAANRRLKRSIARHKIAETTLKKKNEHYSKLLKDSLQLQDGLRQLTRNLLTAQEAERHKISHDLQDEIAQTLLGINVRLLSLRHVTQGSTKGLQKEIAGTQRIVRESSKSVRKFARDLDIQHQVPLDHSVKRVGTRATQNLSSSGTMPSKS
jgi:signal transduction histidine kinase